MGLPKSEPQEMATLTCSSCGVCSMVPEVLYKNWRRSHATFYCPNGHTQYFPGETPEEKLKKENERLQKEKEWANQATMRAEEDAAAKAKELARLKKRIKAGVCPCCKRAVRQLARHMKTKHPGFGEK